jgi:hypothetical protein
LFLGSGGEAEPVPRKPKGQERNEGPNLDGLLTELFDALAGDLGDHIGWELVPKLEQEVALNRMNRILPGLSLGE